MAWLVAALAELAEVSPVGAVAELDALAGALANVSAGPLLGTVPLASDSRTPCTVTFWTPDHNRIPPAIVNPRPTPSNLGISAYLAYGHAWCSGYRRRHSCRCVPGNSRAA